jgi:hypothetical protein
MPDDNPSNNSITQAIRLPDVFDKNDLLIRYRTNQEPSRYVLTIFDDNDKVVMTVPSVGINTESIYGFDDLPNGCYTFQIEDKGLNGVYFGLSSWMYPNQGQGSIRFTNFNSTQTLKSFNPDFGQRIRYSFVLNNFHSIRAVEDINLSVYPNPTTDLLFIQSYESVANALIDIFDVSGKVVFSKSFDLTDNNIIELGISHLVTGSYSVRISKGNRHSWGKFIKS